jgi:CelD/BcsL family acetyltransferase involved in cellulose biosynthesis
MMLTTDRIKVEIAHPGALSSSDIAVWRTLQDANPAFANPLFGPDFALLAGRVRTDARVAVYRRLGQPVAFLAYHARPGGFARPIGAPFSDYQALVAAAGLTMTGAEALALAGLNALRFNGLVDPEGVFGESEGGHSAYAIVLDQAPDAYLEAVRAASPKKFKNYRRLEHRMAEAGEIRFVANDRSQAAFDALMSWKSDQFRQSGLQDVLRPAWVKAMMADLFASEQGLMCSLYVGDTLVAGHFGIRGGATYHPWIASTNPDFNAYSPGQAFLAYAIRAMPGLGLTVYDLGPGHDHYKRPFANVERVIGARLVLADSASGRRAGGRDGLWNVGALGRSGAVDKVRRRLDHIAAVDPSMGGRVWGLVEAVAGATKRGFGNETASPSMA